MHQLVVVGLIGAGAQLVDGSLGMAYGVTSTTLLLGTGMSPAVASASVHLSELGTSLVSGVAHHRFGNVDWKVVRRLAVPGAVGAFLGATLLSRLSTEAGRPWTAGLLLLLGVYILLRFSSRRPVAVKLEGPRKRFLTPLGVAAGFVDATGGGGWGPIATPSLLSTGRMEPRRVIGTVVTSEFLVALGASAGFLLGLGGSGVSYPTVLMLLLGGVVVAPFAAWLVKVLPLALLGVMVGGLVILTNLRTLLLELSVPGSERGLLYALAALLWGVMLVRGVVRHRREGAEVGSA